MEILWEIAWFGPASLALAAFVALAIWLVVDGLAARVGRGR